MAQTSSDYFIQPFRLFGIELNHEVNVGRLEFVELESGRYLTFHFGRGLFSFFVANSIYAEADIKHGLGMNGIVYGNSRGEDHQLHVNCSFPSITVTSWRDVVDAYEQQLPDIAKPADFYDEGPGIGEEETLTNGRELITFMRLLAQEGASSEGLYRLLYAAANEGGSVRQ